jgi:hypothetical protein
MVGKRLALGVLVGSLGLAAVGGLSSSSGQSPETPAPGVSYGGLRDYETVWLRVDESRRVVIALELGYSASGRRCSDKKGYSNILYTGAVYSQPFGVRPDGTVAKTVVVRYSDEGTRYLETLVVKATVKDARVTGTIAGNSKRTKPNGRVVRCTFGPLNWSAVN